MSNKNDRELDDLFRKAAADYASARTGKEGVAGKDAVWKKLEAQLDASAHHSRRRKSGWWVLSLVLLFILLAGFLIWENTGTATRPLAQHTTTAQSEKGEAPAGMKSNLDQTAPGDAVNPVRREKKREKTALPAAWPTVQTRKAGSPVLLLSGNSRKQPELTREEKKGRGGYATTGRYQQLSSLPFPFTKKPPVIPKSIAAELVTNDPEGTNRPEQLSNAAKKEGGKEDTKLQATAPRWSVGFTAGPDWSGVKTRGWKAGVAGGLKLTYRFNRKWAVSSGILLAKKLYDAPPDQYHPADNGWQNYDVRQIKAECLVLDVPLNIKYTLWSREENHIFLGAGLSSFWMKEEQYTYHYKTPEGGWKQWTKKMYNQNNHLFSILNFSAGYQKDWQHFSLQVAPYLKVPLEGIGYGKVKLYGTGLHFTLQYGLK